MSRTTKDSKPFRMSHRRRCRCVRCGDDRTRWRRVASFVVLLLFVIGCGVPDSGVSPVKPIGSDAAHVIPAETKAYNAGLSALYESLAVGVESGELKTVRDAAEKAVAEDKRLRGEYKRAMGAMMEARLGDEELPADASKFFFEMSQAFGRLSK